MLRQLNEKERKVNGENSNELTECLRIYDDQLSKFEQLRDQLTQKEKVISDLNILINNSSKHYLTSNIITSPITPVSKTFIIFKCIILSLIIILELLRF